MATRRHVQTADIGVSPHAQPKLRQNKVSPCLLVSALRLQTRALSVSALWPSVHVILVLLLAILSLTVVPHAIRWGIWLVNKTFLTRDSHEPGLTFSLRGGGLRGH